MCSGGNVHLLRGQSDRASAEVHLETHTVVVRKRLVRLMVVDEEEALVALCAYRPAQRRAVVEPGRAVVRQVQRHAREGRSAVPDQQVLHPQRGVRGAYLSVLPQRCLEVIGDDGQVIGVTGVVRLLIVLGVVEPLGTAVVQVVALPRRAAAELREGERGDIDRGHQGTPVVGDRHAAAQLTGRVGIAAVVRPRSPWGGRPKVRADGMVVADRGEEVMASHLAGPALVGVLPERLRVAPVQRQQHIRGNVRRAPARRRPQWGCDAHPLGHRAERTQVLRLVVQLVLDLDGHDRTALVVRQAAQLLGDARVVRLDERQVRRIVGARGTLLLHQPVGETAVAAFSVRPRPEPDRHVQPELTAQLDEVPDVEGAVEA